VPRISPFNIRRWIARTPDQPLAHHVASLLDVLDGIGTLADQGQDQQGGRGFELFQAAWETLHCHLLRGQTVKLADFFRGARFEPKELGETKIIVEALPLKSVNANLTSKQADEYLTQNVVHYSHTNKAFEFACLFFTPTQTSNPPKKNNAITLCYQCRFSQSSATAPKSKPNTLATKDISELRDKLNNFVKGIILLFFPLTFIHDIFQR
jgi:hypothetical protein